MRHECREDGRVRLEGRPEWPSDQNLGKNGNENFGLYELPSALADG
jgi:hypothetical protein